MGSAQGEYILLGHTYCRLAQGRPPESSPTSAGGEEKGSGDWVGWGGKEIDLVEEVAPAGQAALLWTPAETCDGLGLHSGRWSIDTNLAGERHGMKCYGRKYPKPDGHCYSGGSAGSH